MQRELADRFGVHKGSIQNRERGITEPAIRHVPKIVEFLRFDPKPEPSRLHAWLADARRRVGMPQEEIADALNVAPNTVWRWEHVDGLLPAERLALFHILLGNRVGLLNLSATKRS